VKFIKNFLREIRTRLCFVLLSFERENSGVKENCLRSIARIHMGEETNYTLVMIEGRNIFQVIYNTEP
jgi:hypothetical protein